MNSGNPKKIAPALAKVAMVASASACFLLVGMVCQARPDGARPGPEALPTQNEQEQDKQDQDKPKEVRLEPVLDPGGLGAATALESRVDCDPAQPRKGIVIFRWTPAARAGREQRVVVALSRKGLEGNDVEVSDSVPADKATLVWDRLRGQAIHYWRVMTRQEKGWVPSEAASFEGPTCVADIVPPPSP